MLRDRSRLLKLENIIVIIITIFMTILGTTRRQIFVPDCFQVNRPYGQYRSLRAKTKAHIRVVYVSLLRTCAWITMTAKFVALATDGVSY